MSEDDGFYRLYPGRGWDSHYAAGMLPEQSDFLRFMAVAPSGYFMRWPESRLRRWWMKRRGWVFYGDDGRPEVQRFPMTIRGTWK